MSGDSHHPCPECEGTGKVPVGTPPLLAPWFTALLTEVSAAAYLGTPTPADLRRVLMDVPLPYLLDAGLTAVVEAVCERDGSPFQ